jgi:Tfp pilus assembly protein PilZ
MQRILVKCSSRQDAYDLKLYLETELPFEIALAYSHLEMEQTLRERPTHLLILQTGAPMAKDIQYVQTIRQHGYQYPILLITETLGNLEFDVFSEKYKAFFLEKPFELNALKGLTRKLMVNKSIAQQVYRRYRTAQTATLESLMTSERHESKMYNLSVGGAYFELNKKPDLRVGDIMRVKIPLLDVNRKHYINGRVIWTTHRGHASGGWGIGVRFMKSNDQSSHV